MFMHVNIYVYRQYCNTRLNFVVLLLRIADIRYYNRDACSMVCVCDIIFIFRQYYKIMKGCVYIYAILTFMHTASIYDVVCSNFLS